MKRLFFAFQIESLWPDDFPPGKLLNPEFRHMTLAFLGPSNWEALEPLIPQIPTPPFIVGKVGIFDKCLFLPEKRPHVAAWHIQWLQPDNAVFMYKETLTKFLVKNGFLKSDEGTNAFLSHVSIARNPRFFKLWKKNFEPKTCWIKKLHLFESLGYSKYNSLWNIEYHKPFEEIEHTADIAFKVYAENLSQIHLNAQIALATKFPCFIPYFQPYQSWSSIEEAIISLNKVVSLMDQKEGCPIKAISFHGNIKQKQEKVFEWEMLIDV
jgi:hypothetical protein